jgi:hypothetical protein
VATGGNPSAKLRILALKPLARLWAEETFQRLENLFILVKKGEGVNEPDLGSGANGSTG